ncbi:MAG: FadR/GntR family transcriptional regulator [Hyphomicrobiales bacterium]
MLPARRLADSISDSIAHAVLEGSLAPGDALPSEGEIAREFEVSRPIAREALRHLSAAGLVHTQQGKVARVKALNGEPVDRIYGMAARSSLKRLREANEMRRVVETSVAKLAAERRDAVGIEALERAWDTMRQGGPNPDIFTRADIDFHQAIALTTGNSMIRIQVEGLKSVQREVSELFTHRNTRTPEDWRATIERHGDVFDAILTGNPLAAEQAIIAHYSAADIASLEVASDFLSDADG